MTEVERPGYAAVSPVFRVDGERVPELARDCVRLEITEGLDGLRSAQVWFLGVGAGVTGPPGRMLHLDGGDVDLGRRLQVSIGRDGGQRHVFDGTVSALEAMFLDGEPPAVVVHAEDALMRLRMTRRTRTYTEVTDAEVAARIARDHGLQADTAAEGPRYDVVQQLNQSDLAFLRERARLIRAELWCTERTLHFRARPDRAGTELTLVQGTHLVSVRVCADLAHQRGSVLVGGYDAQGRRPIGEKAGPEVLDAEVTGGRTGLRLVGDALGTSASLRVREAALTTAEARSWARAETLRRGRRFVTASGETRGTPDMTVGSRVRLDHVGGPFEGPGYYVTRVTHTYDRTDGFRTRFEAERSTLNEAS